MAITPNYRQFTQLRMNQPKKIETKSIENTDTTSEQKGTDTSNNTNSKTGANVASQNRTLLDLTMQLQELQFRAAELARKRMKICARLDEIEVQIAKLKSLPQNNQNIQQLKDLQEEKEALKNELDVIDREANILRSEIEIMKMNIQELPYNSGGDTGLLQ